MPMMMIGRRPKRSESGPTRICDVAKPKKKIDSVSCVVATSVPSARAVAGSDGTVMSIDSAASAVIATSRIMVGRDGEVMDGRLVPGSNGRYHGAYCNRAMRMAYGRGPQKLEHCRS